MQRGDVNVSSLFIHLTPRSVARRQYSIKSSVCFWFLGASVLALLQMLKLRELNSNLQYRGYIRLDAFINDKGVDAVPQAFLHHYQSAHSSVTIVLPILLCGSQSSPAFGHNGRSSSGIPGQWESRTGDNDRCSNSCVGHIVTCVRLSPGVSSASDRTAAPKTVLNNRSP